MPYITAKIQIPFVAVSMSASAQLALKAAILCEIMCDDDHQAVQGHSRSPILAPIESLYVTYY